MDWMDGKADHNLLPSQLKVKEHLIMDFYTITKTLSVRSPKLWSCLSIHYYDTCQITDMHPHNLYTNITTLQFMSACFLTTAHIWPLTVAKFKNKISLMIGLHVLILLLLLYCNIWINFIFKMIMYTGGWIKTILPLLCSRLFYYKSKSFQSIRRLFPVQLISSLLGK